MILESKSTTSSFLNWVYIGSKKKQTEMPQDSWAFRFVQTSDMKLVLVFFNILGQSFTIYSTRPLTKGDRWVRLLGLAGNVHLFTMEDNSMSTYDVPQGKIR